MFNQQGAKTISRFEQACADFASPTLPLKWGLAVALLASLPSTAPAARQIHAANPRLRFAQATLPPGAGPTAPIDPAVGSAPVVTPSDAPKPGDTLFEPPPLTEPPPILPDTPPMPREATTLFPATDPLSPQAAVENQKFGIVLHGYARATYDSNIFIQAQHEEEDFIFTLAPGVAIGWGDFKSEIFGTGGFRQQFERDFSEAVLDKNFIYIDYTPSVTFFAHNADENSFDHDVNLEGQWVIRKLTLGMRARFQTLNLPDVDIGDRVEQKRFSAALTSKYDYSEKTNFEFNLYSYLRDYKRNSDTREYRNQGWINYQIQPRINFGVGYAVGYVDSSEGPEQFYEQALLRARYKVSEKLSFVATFGGEIRQVETDDHQTNPVFSVGATWTPLDGTYVMLNAYSRTQTSSSLGQNYTVTGFDATVRQRFFQRMYVGVAGGYQNSDYDALSDTKNTARTDDLYYVRPSIGVDLAVWASAEAAFEWRSNDSSDERRSFDEVSSYLQLNLLF